MRNKVFYEWKLETIEAGEPVDSMESDIVDIDFAAAGNLQSIYPPGPQQRICLVRDVGNQEEGLQERDHAYIVNGELAVETIEDRHTVPQRFHAELAKVVVARWIR